MNLTGLDLPLVTKLISEQIYNVTCLECCKYYIAPETAACGHTLCHSCWSGRRSCPSCAAPLERRLLKLNLSMQTLTELVYSLGKMFEKLFDIKLDEFVSEVSVPAVQSVDDPTKNVKDWLASSQNHFSAPMLNSEISTQEENNAIEILSSKIQIHTTSKKSNNPDKVVYVHQPQDDWDKIEQEVDLEENCTNKKKLEAENKPGISLIEENEYNLDNPRRSSRKKDLNQSEPTIRGQDTSLDPELKSTKAKQNWNNVKRMRKEFSKLNKQNRNKLNVSIEMCKKAQRTVAKENIVEEQQKLMETESPQSEYIIEDNTPVVNIEKPKDLKRNVVTELSNNDTVNKTNKSIDNVTKETAISNTNYTLLHTNNLINLDQASNKNMSNKKSSANEIPENFNNDFQNNPPKFAFVKKSMLCPNQEETVKVQTINIDDKTGNANAEDIEISIRIGNTLTNIVIQKKTKDVQLKVNTDREVQTSLGVNFLVNKDSQEADLQKNNNTRNLQMSTGNDKSVVWPENQNKDPKIKNKNTIEDNILLKSFSTKKNTASAETATAQYEITESVEKELSKIMECDEVVNDNQLYSKPQCNLQNVNNKNGAPNNSQITYDLDISENFSICEQTVHALKESDYAASDILIPTAKSTKLTNHPDKRHRHFNEDNEMPNPKKIKSMSAKCNKSDVSLTCNILQEKNRVDADNDSMNYDVVMDQVFANIDADIQKSQKLSYAKSTTQSKEIQELREFEQKLTASTISSLNVLEKQPISKRCLDEKYSENVFSVVEKDIDSHDVIVKGTKECGSTQSHILTQGMGQDLVSNYRGNLQSHIEVEVVDTDICTPHQDQDDSDKSVVEETPQKNVSYSKPKNKNTGALNIRRTNSGATNEVSRTPVANTVINLSDSVVDLNKTSKDTEVTTTLTTDTKKQELDTPLTINRFVDHITHMSTPAAKKSLNFESEHIEDGDDPKQTLCPSSVIAKTTLEKEFMCKAFEQTPKSSMRKPLATNNTKIDDLKYCIAGSCLSVAELTNVKLLCRKYNWKYVDKYTKELTHLVVGVDDENKSQRSVKYMCALAASKWIVSYKWVETCLKTNLVVAENHYEALDGSGEPGPRRSRLAKKKLFEGITFYCMPPFSVLEVNTLKEMLEASGGQVVNEKEAVEATSDAPAFLLAEPEHTQENKYFDMAIKKIVPLNYEWVLNCLGDYELDSIHDLLLCPSTLLPPATSKWPAILMSRDNDCFV